MVRSWLLSSSRQACPRSRSHASTSLRRSVQQRPDDLARPGINRRQPDRPGAASQAQQHRFRLIVPGVAHRHPRRAARRRDLAQEADIGRFAPHLRWKFCGPAPRPRRRRGDCRTATPSRAARSRQHASSASAASRSWWLRWASPASRAPRRGARSASDERQRGRIRAARHGGDEDVAGPEERLLGNRLLDPLEEPGHKARTA